jgi:basic amino acid/polyamine antiporter, APA family
MTTRVAPGHDHDHRIPARLGRRGLAAAAPDHPPDAFTAASYAELVTKYPQAAGAALYSHKAYKRPFVTFLVAFAVMCSGVASAATLATAFGGDYLSEFVTLPEFLVGAVFLGVLALINFRGIKESVSLNL